MKACPECGAQNSIDARACARCNHVFGHAPAAPAPASVPAAPAPASVPPASPSRARAGLSRSSWLWIAIGGIALIGFCIFVILGFSLATRYEASPTVVVLVPTATPTPNATRTPTAVPRTATPAASPTPTSNSIQNALRAVVQILVPAENPDDGTYTGSGSIITSRGYILTNLHVVVDPDTGQMYNSRDEIYIGITVNPNSPPSIAYRARLVDKDSGWDLALLQITQRRDGSKLPDNLNLYVLPTGNSDALSVGDALTLLGYPGLGGETITLTRGTVSGFLPDEGWIKTDGEINPGNSGGAALNQAGELIGVPSAGISSKKPQGLPGKLGLIRPIRYARALIDRAKQDSGN